MIKTTKVLLVSILVLISMSPAGRIVGWGYDNYGQVSNIPEGVDFVAIGAGACISSAKVRQKAL